MSFDCSRFTFRPWKDLCGVVMQQGRVQLDADWNEWVAQVARRLQAGTLDTLGAAVVPRTTPSGFEIQATAGVLTIGRGRMYVDGLLAENHGTGAADWDPRLAESRGSSATVPFFEQPYLPFNPADQPAPADVFNRPALAGGPHLAYLDVWQRELTYLQDPELVEKAVGIDTTGRLQTVWQVKVLQDIAGADCASADDAVPGWGALTRPSGARLSTSTGDLPLAANPCEIPPAAGYKGLENQLYRVEIHRGGPQGNATFKWSRDNATVATRVTEIQGGSRLVVESVGRDDTLGFHGGEWIEILDDWHELHGRPGLLRRIRLADGVDLTTRSILIDDPLPPGLFPVDSMGRTESARHTRIRRWDQSGQVRRADGTVFHNLDAAASSDGIPVPGAGERIALEFNILIELQLDPGNAEFKTGETWVFAARAADGTIEELDRAPPRGIHHHFARLAIVTLPDAETSCRVLWPPEAGEESCDCTVCVGPEGHNSGAATIQQAIDRVRTRGGTVCLDAGAYRIDRPLDLEGARSVRIRGQGWRTVLQAGEAGQVVRIAGGIGVTIENLAILGVARGDGTTALINVVACVDLALSHLAVVALPGGDGTSAAVSLGGLLFGVAIRECALVAERGIVSPESREAYLLTAQTRLIDNLLVCSQTGIRLTGAAFHYGELRIAGNLLLRCEDTGIMVTGGALPSASVTIEGNVLQAAGTGLRVGTDGLRIAENEITATPGERLGDGIVFESGFDKSPIDHALVMGNRIRGMRGNGIAVRHTLGEAMIKSNVVEEIGLAALVMEDSASAQYLCFENNQLTDLGMGFIDEARPYIGVRLLGAVRADVIGNLFSGVAREATGTRLRTALSVLASAELRVAGNRLLGIGPVRFVDRTIAMTVDAPFRDVAVDHNAAQRAGAEATALVPAEWQAIVIGRVGLPGPEDPTRSIAFPDIRLLPHKDSLLLLTSFYAALYPRALASVALRGNTVRGQLCTLPLVDVLVDERTTDCLFNDNDVHQLDLSEPAARIRCKDVSVGHNRLVTPDGQVLLIQARRFAVVGNVPSGEIVVNGAALGPPWRPLNLLP